MVAPGPISAVWANDGADKVTQDEIRSANTSRSIVNRVWDGKQIRLFGARNEVVAANLVLEAANGAAAGVTVEFDTLTGPDEFRIRSLPAKDKDGLFSWVDRDIELFLVRYLEIAGLSRMAYETYDERHVPERLRLPKGLSGSFGVGWNSRPDHNKLYPDIAVPLELEPTFTIPAGRNQSIWIDIYIPKAAPPGRYAGEIVVKAYGEARYQIPVELTVRGFTLPDLPSSKTMIAVSYEQVAQRYAGTQHPGEGSPEDALTRRVMDRQFLVAHRHKLSLIDGNHGADPWPHERPRPEWVRRLSGELFTPAHGYQGPGAGTGNNVFSIGTYGSWREWIEPTDREALWQYADHWEQWFRDSFPDTERFLYLIDESTDYPQTEQWAAWMKSSPGIGRKLPSLATVSLPDAEKHIPSLGVIASLLSVGDTGLWQAAVDRVTSDAMKRFFAYNGVRPASGSFVIEDEGVALRELPWGQYKKGIHRWFYWEATYYDDFQSGRGATNVFANAQTFGAAATFDRKLGRTGFNAMNGDGVLFYPGIDTVFPQESYGLEGPIGSLRLKHWRRGVQDVDYLVLARAEDPAAVTAIVERMVPKVLWENGVGDPKDPTWVRVPISWPTDPDAWETARAELADIIERR